MSEESDTKEQKSRVEIERVKQMIYDPYYIDPYTPDPYQ